MINDVFEVKWKEFRGKIRKWWDERSGARLVKVNSKREQFVGILQKRYGYTKEKATSELNQHYSNVKFG